MLLVWSNHGLKVNISICNERVVMRHSCVAARLVFERWMEWQPEEQAWFTYVKFELRYKELERARDIYGRFIMVHPAVKNWIRYAK